jgi:hypothetical protein
MRVAKPALKSSKLLLKRATLEAIRRSLAIHPVRRFAGQHVLQALDYATANLEAGRLPIVKYAASKLAVELARARPNGHVDAAMSERRSALGPSHARDVAPEDGDAARPARTRPSTSLRGR